MALDFVSRIASDYLMGLGKTAALLTDRVSRADSVSAEVSLPYGMPTKYKVLTCSGVASLRVSRV